MTNSKLVVAALAALSLTAGRAYAEGDDPCGADPCGGGEEMANPCGGGEGGEGGEAMSAEGGAAEDGAAMAGGYPQAVIDRPAVLPKGMLEVTGLVPLLVKPSPLSAGLVLGARYGVAPKIDAALSYGFSLKEFEIKGDLGVAVQYSVIEEAKMLLAAKVSTGYSVVGEEFSGVGLGAYFQYNITPKIAVISPGDQITIGFSDGIKPLSLNLPIGFGFQANEKIYAFANTSIGTIGLSPSGNSLISDITPLQVGATFSPSNMLDVGASVIFPDVQSAADFIGVGLQAAYRM